jgi:hypothetical protein
MHVTRSRKVNTRNLPVDTDYECKMAASRLGSFARHLIATHYHNNCIAEGITFICMVWMMLATPPPHPPPTTKRRFNSYL